MHIYRYIHNCEAGMYTSRKMQSAKLGQYVSEGTTKDFRNQLFKSISNFSHIFENVIARFIYICIYIYFPNYKNISKLMDYLIGRYH